MVGKIFITHADTTYGLRMIIIRVTIVKGVYC